MSVSHPTSASSNQKNKKGSSSRPLSSLVGSDLLSFGVRSDMSECNEPLLASRTKVLTLLKELEREFEWLFVENQTLQEKLDNYERLAEKENERTDVIDGEGVAVAPKNIGKKLSLSSQKLKTAQRLKAQTSRIVKNFKSLYTCNLVKEFIGHSDGVWQVSVARHGVPLIGSASADHTARIWHVNNTKCMLHYRGHSGSVNSICFHPTRDLVLTASGDWTTHIWQAAFNWELKGNSSDDEIDSEELEMENTSTLRTPICELHGHTGAVLGAEWLCSGEHVITASWDRLALLHDIETHAVVQTLPGHDQELTHTATHPSQRLALTSSRDTTFRLWDLRDNASHSTVCVFQGHSDSVTASVFAPDDKIVSSSDDRTVKIWDLKNMRSPYASIRLDSAVNRLAVSWTSNGGGGASTTAGVGVIALPHDCRNVRLFDLNGKRLARLPRSRRQGHTRMVSSAAWADEPINGANLFTSGFDKQVLGWLVSGKDGFS